MDTPTFDPRDTHLVFGAWRKTPAGQIAREAVARCGVKIAEVDAMPDGPIIEYLVANGLTLRSVLDRCSKWIGEAQ